MSLSLLDWQKNTTKKNLTNHGATDSADTPFGGLNTDSVAMVSASSQYLDAGDSDDFSISTTGKLTIEFWAKPTVVGSLLYTQRPVDKGDTSNFEYGMDFGSNGVWEGIVYNLSGSGQRYYVTSGTAKAVLNTWDQWAFVVDDSGAWANTNAKIFEKGVDVSSGNGGSSGNTIGNGTASLLFGHKANNSDYADTLMDDIRVWNTGRSTAQVAANYNNRLTGLETGLVGYYPCEPLFQGEEGYLFGGIPTSLQQLQFHKTTKIIEM